MSELKRPNQTLSFDPDKCSDLYQELVEVFQKYKPTVGELLIAYSNLGYTLGASIGGYKDKGPSMEELEKLYYSQPSLDVALMLQAMTVGSWYDEWEKQVLENKTDTGV